MLVFFNQVTPRYTVPISLFVDLEFIVFRSSDILAFNEENFGGKLYMVYKANFVI